MDLAHGVWTQNVGTNDWCRVLCSCFSFLGEGMVFSTHEKEDSFSRRVTSFSGTFQLLTLSFTCTIFILMFFWTFGLVHTGTSGMVHGKIRS